MTDSESNPVAKASSAWTDPERWAFVMQIIKQLTKDGAKIKWTEIDMPGRTTKSLTHAWEKIRKEAASFNAAADGDVPVTPSAKAPVKRTKKTADGEADGDGDESPSPKKKKTPAKVKAEPLVDEDGNPIETPKKKRATPAKKTPAKAKVAKVEDVNADAMKEEEGAEA